MVDVRKHLAAGRRRAGRARLRLKGVRDSRGASELQRLGVRYGTDKSRHSYAGRSYLDVYEMYFSPLRNKAISLLEIGVRDGDSLRSWKAYFPNASIFGLDIDPRCKTMEEERISIHIGSQENREVLERVASQAGGFDVIIDDGSHLNQHILRSFDVLFPHLRPHGVYAIEDLGTSYVDLTEDVKGWPGMELNRQDQDFKNVREDMDRFFLSLVEDLDHRRGEVAAVHFWPMMCIMLKTALDQ